MSKFIPSEASKKNTIGRWVTVLWDDIGRQDGIIVSIRHSGRITKRTEFDVFFVATSKVDSVSADQIIDIRGFLEEKK